MSLLSPSTETALAHLKRIRSNDGWGVETNKSLVRLTRRKVPVTNGYFLDLAVEKGTVVGILTGVQRSDGTVQAQKLVDANGKLVGNTVQLVSVSNYGNIKSHRRPNASTTHRTAAGELSNEQNQDIIKYGIFAVLAAIAVRVISSSLSGLFVLILPILYLYLLSTCPVCMKNGSFLSHLFLHLKIAG